MVSPGVSPLAGKLFVVLGAGGAGKSLAYGAAQKGARVVVANRTFGNKTSLFFHCPKQRELENMDFAVTCRTRNFSVHVGIDDTRRNIGISIFDRQLVRHGLSIVMINSPFPSSAKIVQIMEHDRF